MVSWHPVSDASPGEDGWGWDADRRAERVDRIHAAIEEGSYAVAAEDVADAILRFYERGDGVDPSSGASF